MNKPRNHRSDKQISTSQQTTSFLTLPFLFPLVFFFTSLVFSFQRSHFIPPDLLLKHLSCRHRNLSGEKTDSNQVRKLYNACLNLNSTFKDHIVKLKSIGRLIFIAIKITTNTFMYWS